MNSIAFIDTEIEPRSRRILDIGSIKSDGSSFHKPSVTEFSQFLKGAQFICGHNIFNHDLKYIGKAISDAGVEASHVIDTLFLSPLLFPTKPYHALLKDDKLQSDDTNNPLNDSIKARDILHDEIAAFAQTDETLKQIFYLLLKGKKSMLKPIIFSSEFPNISSEFFENFRVVSRFGLVQVVIDFLPCF